MPYEPVMAERPAVITCLCVARRQARNEMTQQSATASDYSGYSPSPFQGRRRSSGVQTAYGLFVPRFARNDRREALHAACSRCRHCEERSDVAITMINIGFFGLFRRTS